MIFIPWFEGIFVTISYQFSEEKRAELQLEVQCQEAAAAAAVRPVTPNNHSPPLTPPTHLMCVVCFCLVVLPGLLGLGRERWRVGWALQ